MTGVLTPCGSSMASRYPIRLQSRGRLFGQGTPLGIKIASVEPGGMRTDWGEIARGQVPEILPDYTASQPARSLQCYFQVCGNLAGIRPRAVQQ
jgi:hypothetical protein